MQRLTIVLLIQLKFLVYSESQPADNVSVGSSTDVNYSKDTWTHIIETSQEPRSTSWESTSSVNIPSSQSLPWNDFTTPITKVSMSTCLESFNGEGMDSRCEPRLYIEKLNDIRIWKIQ